jgi:hypothetical protein
VGELAANEPREAGLLHERAAEIHEVLAAEFERAAHAESTPVSATENPGMPPFRVIPKFQPSSVLAAVNVASPMPSPLGQLIS